jgi:DNA-binding Lrp family transcriptional regulator
MDEVDSKILFETNKGLLLTPEPFNEIALKLGITHQEVITRIIKLRKGGVIRRFGASIKPNDLGFSANALIAWKVPENRVQEVGSCLAKYPEVTHCYERKAIAGKWEYNLYTVMHARKREGIEQLSRNLSEVIAVNDYQILYSTRDLKRAYSRSVSTVLPSEESSAQRSSNFEEIRSL